VSRQGENIKSFILGGATTNRIDPDYCIAAQSGKASASPNAVVESIFSQRHFTNMKVTS
jgi:hypothetical protein